MEESRGPMTKEQLERICYRCHQVNKRGSLCLLLLRDGSNCARRAFLQRHHRAALRPRVVPQAGVGTNPLPRLPRLPQPTGPPESNILVLRATYGNSLSRWHGLFARLGNKPAASAPD